MNSYTCCACDKAGQHMHGGLHSIVCPECFEPLLASGHIAITHDYSVATVLANGGYSVNAYSVASYRALIRSDAKAWTVINASVGCQDGGEGDLAPEALSYAWPLLAHMRRRFPGVAYKLRYAATVITIGGVSAPSGWVATPHCDGIRFTQERLARLLFEATPSIVAEVAVRSEGRVVDAEHRALDVMWTKTHTGAREAAKSTAARVFEIAKKGQ